MNRLALAAIRQLLRFGEAAASDLEDFKTLHNLGIVRPSEDGDHAVATPGLAQMLRLLGSREAEAGIFALFPEIQEAWVKVVCARIEEMGIRRDLQALFDTIEQLGASADVAVNVWNERGLDDTSFAPLEREILGAPAHEAVSAPKLLRAVSAAGAILADPSAKNAGPLTNVHDQDPEGNGVKGRILLSPGLARMNATSAVLNGTLESLKIRDDGTSMAWAFA